MAYNIENELVSGNGGELFRSRGEEGKKAGHQGCDMGSETEYGALEPLPGHELM